MSVRCNQRLTPLSTEEFRELDYRVMRHAFEAQNELGRLADERIYQADLSERLRSDRLGVICELEIELSHQAFSKSLFVDLVADQRGIYELKVAKALSDAHSGQLLTYLLLLNLPRGKVVNFGGPKVESRFVNAALSTDQRQSFRFDDRRYVGEEPFRTHVLNLLRDWGTSLTLSLYESALVSLLGGPGTAEAMMPLRRRGVLLGNQRFRLAAPDTGFEITALNSGLSAYESQLARLIRYSPLRAMHWVNIWIGEVTLATVFRGEE